MPGIANRDEANKCLDIAQRALEERDLTKAEKFVEKAGRLFHNSEVGCRVGEFRQSAVHTLQQSAPLNTDNSVHLHIQHRHPHSICTYNPCLCALPLCLGDISQVDELARKIKALRAHQQRSNQAHTPAHENGTSHQNGSSTSNGDSATAGASGQGQQQAGRGAADASTSEGARQQHQHQQQARSTDKVRQRHGPTLPKKPVPAEDPVGRTPLASQGEPCWCWSLIVLVLCCALTLCPAISSRCILGGRSTPAGVGRGQAFEGWVGCEGCRMVGWLSDS